MTRQSIAAFVAFLTAAIVSIAAGVAIAQSSEAQSANVQASDLENTLYLDVGSKTATYGRVVIKMRPDLAPNHVARIKELTRRKFYDGLLFHRVIENFMAQTGDPKGTGEGGSTLPDLKPEFTDTPIYRGMVAMARADSPDSANSQFFIMLGDEKRLNGNYTVWGEVVGGMEFVDQIKIGNRKRDGAVDDPDRIVRMQVAADARG